MSINPAPRVANPGWSLQAAADFTRGGGPPAPDHDADLESRKSRLEAEETRLLEWAAQNGALSDRVGLPEVGGGEHWVYHDEVSGRYLKEPRISICWGYGFSLGRHCRGATPSEYLDRLDLQNQIFGDDIQIVRIVDRGAKPVPVISQPAIAGVPASPVAIDELMSAKGFERLWDWTYYNGKGLLIFDLGPQNAIQTSNGEVRPIDPVIQRITQDFVDYLRKLHRERSELSRPHA